MARTPPKSLKPASRSVRLAQALRANLKRRKAQAKSRADAKNQPEQPKLRD